MSNNFPSPKPIESYEVFAVTYIKCKSGCAPKFAARFKDAMKMKQIWHMRDVLDDDQILHEGEVVPLLICTTAGFFDYLVCTLGSSTAVVSAYLARIIRAEPTTEGDEIYKRFGDLVTDTHTSIGVIEKVPADFLPVFSEIFKS